MAVEELQHRSESQSNRIKQLEEQIADLPTNLKDRLDAIWAYIDNTRERLMKAEKCLGIDSKQTEAELNQKEEATRTKLVKAVFCGKCGKPMDNETTLENGEEIYACKNRRCGHMIVIQET